MIVIPNEGNYFFRFPRDEFWSRTIVKDSEFAGYIYQKTTFDTCQLELKRDEGRPFSMHKKIEGTPLAEKIEELSEEEITKVSEDIAKFMAELHQLDFQKEKIFTINDIGLNLSEFLNELLTKHVSKEDRAFWRFADTVETPECLVHGDLNLSNVLLDAIKGQDFSNNELITVMPINFTIDGENSVRNPQGMKGSLLESKVVISTSPKEPLYRILEVLKLCGLEAVDVAYTSVGDYYAIKNRKYDELVGAIINIGEESTNVSVFNKGIQIKNSLLPIGSNNVDNDIAYAFKIKGQDSRAIKENFAVALASYADTNDVWDLQLDKDNKKEINQVAASKVVEARVKEILKLAKNEIKNLTNREIRYIIITGGLSELAGFQYLVEQEFGFVAKVCKISTMGIRHNKYSSCYGVTKYFDDKLNLRGKHCDMISREDIETLLSIDSTSVTNESLLSKVFGHFFDN